MLAGFHMSIRLSSPPPPRFAAGALVLAAVSALSGWAATPRADPLVTPDWIPRRSGGVAAETDGRLVCPRPGATVPSRLCSANGVVELPLRNLAALSGEDAVQWIEPPLPLLSALGDDMRIRTGGDCVQDLPYNRDARSVLAPAYGGATVDAAHSDLGGRIPLRETVPDYYTEYFRWLVYNDLQYHSIMFSPNGSPDFYSACVQPITDLPVNPAGGTPVLLADDDATQVSVQQGRRVWLYGVSYSTFFIGSNGWITFGSGDPSPLFSLTNHFQRPRISGVGDDLVPNVTNPNISYKQLPDRVAVTYDNVWEWWFFGGGPSTFQIEMFFDGRIRISFLDIGASWCITGLSAGQGLPPDFQETDFSQLGCQPAPPRAYNVNVTTALNTPVTVTLHGEDDGLPNPPGALEYTILSLPIGGTLHDLAGGEITAVPYTLLNYGAHVQYRPNIGFGGVDRFDYKANDGGTPYGGGDSNIASVSVYVSAPRLIRRFTFDTDPGWVTQGQWAFGRPLGLGSYNRDPTSGYTGANVYGYNLAGDYENNLPPTHLTTTPVDCSQLGATELRFRRWLGVETAWFDHASVAVSNDGANWVTVWNHTGVTIAETAWSLQAYDISAVADGEATVYIRWTMGPTNGQRTYPGWNIDDVEIWALAPLEYGAGDLNCDGIVSFSDIDPFALYLSDLGLWQATYPDCPVTNGDVNGDGEYPSFADIDPFVALLNGD